MDQAHTRALAALQPFIVILSTAKEPSPRFIADNISRATAAPGTYVFTELLQLPAVQSLRSASPEHQAWLTHLEIFSYGTLEEYHNTPNLPSLTDAQADKLRQLTLLTLASSPTTPLSYTNLMKALSLQSAAALERVITSAIYSSLLTARLSPASTPPTVHITSVAPLRDLRPHSLPTLLNILDTWSSRCDDVMSSLSSQITSIKSTASHRQASQKRRQEIVDAAVAETQPNAGNTFGPTAGTGGRALRNKGRGGTKRELEQADEEEDDAYEDVEDGSGGDEITGNGKMDLDPEPPGGFGSSHHGGAGAAATRGNKKSRGKLHP